MLWSNISPGWKVNIFCSNLCILWHTSFLFFSLIMQPLEEDFLDIFRFYSHLKQIMWVNICNQLISASAWFLIRNLLFVPIRVLNDHFAMCEAQFQTLAKGEHYTKCYKRFEDQAVWLWLILLVQYIPDVGCPSEVEVEEVFFSMTEKTRAQPLHDTSGEGHVPYINFDFFPEAVSRYWVRVFVWKYIIVPTLSIELFSILDWTYP